jgi:hypothetical protein
MGTRVTIRRGLAAVPPGKMQRGSDMATLQPASISLNTSWAIWNAEFAAGTPA